MPPPPPPDELTNLGAGIGLLTITSNVLDVLRLLAELLDSDSWPAAELQFL